jgi:sigma-B regulation protein RsbU (phosphoserine phosphatase)
VAPGARLPGDYPSVLACRRDGTVLVTTEDPRLDPELETRLGSRRFAALETGDEQFLLSFDLESEQSPEEVLFSLGLLRHAISQKIRHERMQEVLREARRIQSSILPRQMPSFGPFDIAGRSDALETVGGDFFDFIPITDKILGVAIADVSGHGLPAALQVRDVYMGLRMGMARDFKIVRTVERLNQIIHHSTLTSRFVSMFYGELERDGTFIYVNAGHPPPFHLAKDGTLNMLEKGGVVLGPVPGATYMRGYLTLAPGDLLLFYTDGVVDTDCDGGTQDSEYGVKRLVEVATRHRVAAAQEIVEAVFDDLAHFCDRAEPGDDRTVAVVSYPEPRE